MREGTPFKEAIVRAATTRAMPVVLTGMAAMPGAFFTLDDPNFNGLVISLIFGIFVSTVLTMAMIPIRDYFAYRRRLTAFTCSVEPDARDATITASTPSSIQGG